jgi:adenine phosphoribosyltransferase
VDVDIILTIEAMGIPIAVTLSELLNKPVNIIRKVQRFLPGEIILDQKTGYSRGKLYLNGISESQEVLVVDAVISTGGTLIATLNGLKRVNAKIKDIVCVIDRDDGVNRVKLETGYTVKTLVRINVNDHVKVVRDYFSR